MKLGMIKIGAGKITELKRSYFPLGDEEGQICINFALKRLTLPVFIHLPLNQVPWFPDLLDLEA